MRCETWANSWYKYEWEWNGIIGELARERQCPFVRSVQCLQTHVTWDGWTLTCLRRQARSGFVCGVRALSEAGNGTAKTCHHPAVCASDRWPQTRVWSLPQSALFFQLFWTKDWNLKGYEFFIFNSKSESLFRMQARQPSVKVLSFSGKVMTQSAIIETSFKTSGSGVVLSAV